MPGAESKNWCTGIPKEGPTAVFVVLGSPDKDPKCFGATMETNMGYSARASLNPLKTNWFGMSASKATLPHPTILNPKP